MDPYVIGIDLGTGSAKAVAVNQTGDVIDSARVAYPIVCPKQGYQEQAPELIWQAFIKSISRITANLHGSPVAISLSSAMHSVIPVDKNGNPLMNMIIWADNRSAAIAKRIRQSSAAEMLYEQTGTPIHPMSPLCKIVWLKENDAELFQKTSKFISIKEYIWLKLFGEYEVDYSIASATGLMDIEKLTWSANSLDVASLRSDHLSTLVNANHFRTCPGGLCAQLGVSKDTRFFIGASDGCLANIGSFATQEGLMALTIGTSGAVRILSKAPMQNFKDMSFNYRLDDSAYVCGGPTNNGGLILKWYAEKLLRKELATADDYSALFNTLVDTSPGADGLVFLPYLLGERAPIWNSNACGVFFGIRGDHQQAHFTRAVIEGISMALYDIAYGMMANGLPVKQIHVSGGFVHSDEWLQILANIFRRKICLINTADASAIGAAFLGLKNIGLIKSYDEMKPENIREFHPQRECLSAYRELFTKYRNLYEKVAPLMSEEK